jgi:hypothetical protein
MSTMVPNRRSSFGMKCVQCSDELIAPVRSEYRNERQIHHVWHCWNCQSCFETIPTMRDIKTRDDFVSPLLVA